MYLNLFYKFSVYIISTCILILGFASCSNSDKATSGFVYLDGKDFKLNGQDFYPVVLNYSSDLKADSNALWASPNIGYEDKDAYNKKAGNLRFKADMQMIKDLGFNTVRL